ncbi:MAG: enoyl-CoA hydratase/isomerase family protein [Ectothiorhodospiraceae bacterium]|nr:enoyl-CoA hydratase/isomerase family protein [Ectothiorhodospiraceae bacterium]
MSRTEPLVLSTVDDGLGEPVATVTINNPRKLNVMNSALMEELVSVLQQLARHPALRAVVLTGAGEKAFVGGADIREMGTIDNPSDAEEFISRVHACCDAVRSVPVPVIARVRGYTFGAGMELAAACDVRIATDDSVFGMPEVRLGIPSVVEAALLPMLIGWGRTRELLLFAENINADTAAAWGFVEKVVSADRLDDTVDHYLRALLASPPLAIRNQKQLIRDWEDLPLRAAVNAGISAFASAFTTDEPRSAMREFLQAQAERKHGKGG